VSSLFYYLYPDYRKEEEERQELRSQWSKKRWLLRDEVSSLEWVSELCFDCSDSKEK
jgi:hypothetical protein